MNGGYRRDEELTETRTGVVVASGEVSEARFVGGGELERERMRG